MLGVEGRDDYAYRNKLEASTYEVGRGASFRSLAEIRRSGVRVNDGQRW